MSHWGNDFEPSPVSEGEALAVVGLYLVACVLLLAAVVVCA